MKPAWNRSPGARAIAATLAATVFLQAIGCSSVADPTGKAANVNHAGADHTARQVDDAPTVTISALLPDEGLRTVLRMEPAIVWLAVDPAWSNRSARTKHVSFSTEADRQYVVLAYEMGQGVVSATVALSSPDESYRSSGSSSSSGWGGLGGAGGPGIGLLVVLVLLWKLASSLANRQTSPNTTEECCFVWVEDAESGEIIAGASPWAIAEFPGNETVTPRLPQ